jgi:hypothetical protein
VRLALVSCPGDGGSTSIGPSVCVCTYSPVSFLWRCSSLQFASIVLSCLLLLHFVSFSSSHLGLLVRTSASPSCTLGYASTSQEAKERPSLVPKQSGHGQPTPPILAPALSSCPLHSLGYAPGPLWDLALTSQPTLGTQRVHHATIPRHHHLPPPHRHLFSFSGGVQCLNKRVPCTIGSASSQTLFHLGCASFPRLRDSVSILQDLVFAVRKDVDDLLFRLEHLDQRTKKIEYLLATLLRSLHSPELGTNAPTSSGAFLALDIQVDNRARRRQAHRGRRGQERASDTMTVDRCTGVRLHVLF